MSKYYLGHKLSIDNYDISKCDTFDDVVWCGDGDRTAKFQRITGEYTEINYSSISIFACTKSNKKI